MTAKHTSGVEPTELAPRRNQVIRTLRVVRDCLGDEGMVQKIYGNAVVATLHDTRTVWLVLNPLLWWFEQYFGHYTMTDPMDRLSRVALDIPDVFGPVGRALNSKFMYWFNLVVLVWLVVDTAFYCLHKVLDKLVAEPYEIARREYDEARRQLGDESDDEDERDSSLLAPLVTNSWFRYFMRAVLGLAVIQMVSDAGNDVYDVALTEYSAAPEPTAADLAALNPYRLELPPSQDAVIRDLLYFEHVLIDVTPTTLPDDDYQLYSGILRSLETRTDISWRSFEETDIRQRIMYAANRDKPGRLPIANEPFFLDERFKALSSHWEELGLQPDKPERWQEASETTFLKPLLQGRALEGQLDGAEFYQYQLSPEQEAQAERIYKAWRSERDRKARYLQAHPPTPMAWVPIPKSDIGIRSAWASIYDEGRITVGKSVSSSKLVNSKQWKPIFRSLNLERIPWDFERETRQEDIDTWLDIMTEKNNRLFERLPKQDSYQLELAEKEREAWSKLEL